MCLMSHSVAFPVALLQSLEGLKRTYLNKFDIMNKSFMLVIFKRVDHI